MGRRAGANPSRATPRLLAALAAAGLSLAMTGTAAAPAQVASPPTLSGRLVHNVQFPDRTLVLTAPRNVAVGVGQLHVTENGKPVRALTANSLHQANVGDLGIIMLIDSDPSMAGAPISHAMTAAQALAAQRTGKAELGVIGCDGSSLPLTSDSQTIDAFLARPPKIVHATNLLAATQAAINELKTAHIIDGAIIYVSDDIDKAPGLSLPTLGENAAAAGVRIYTVAIHDRATGHPDPRTDQPLSAMKTLADSSGGTFALAEPAALRQTFDSIVAGLTSQYVVHYRSRVRFDRPVTVSVRVKGIPAPFVTRYVSPLPPSGPITTTRRQPGFWTSTAALVVVSLVCAALLGFAVGIVLTGFRRSGELRSRVHMFVPPAEHLEFDAHRAERDRARSGPRPLPVGLRWWPRFVAKLEISSFTRPPVHFVYLAIFVSLLAILAIDVITGSALAACVGLLVGPLVVRWLVNRNVRLLRLRFMEQLPGQIHEIAGAMRTGRSMAEAVGVVAEEADEPMRRELSRAIADEKAGLALEEALRPVGVRMESTEIEQVAVVAALHRRTGANITEVLDRMADSARQRVDIRRELLTLTAQARLSRNVLVSLPIFVTIAIDIIGQQYERPLFHTRSGIAVLVVGGLMVAVGAQVMKAIVDVDE